MRVIVIHALENVTYFPKVKNVPHVSKKMKIVVLRNTFLFIFVLNEKKTQ